MLLSPDSKAPRLFASRPSNAVSPNPADGTCPGGKLLSTALLCADPLATGAVAAFSDGSCPAGHVPTYTGLCFDGSAIGVAAPDATTGACEIGVLNFDGVCVTPPSPALGASPGYGQPCTGFALHNSFGLCVSSTVSGATSPISFTGCAGDTILNAQAVCVSAR